ncbi:MAG TPA: pyridoxal phosphate-dependent aminotransferase [Bryobacteraceae bacterium]|nr:pyridoxal phosphate-dependent aminotransferase [Bryobacteraceae bacterium]
MPQSLSVTAQESLLSRGFSRRQLGRIASVLTAGAVLPFYNEAAYAQRAMRGRGRMSPDAVRINSNENPLGPCPEALEAICAEGKLGGRYSPHNEQGDLTDTIAAMEGLKPEYVSVFAGSSDPLHRSACAFTSPTRAWVMGDPGYESGAGSAKFIGAKAIHVPLRKDYAHDVKAMLAADPNPGLIYICNPNNPTGTLTPRSDIEYVVANMPKDCVLMVDEAYWHFTTKAPTAVDLVKADKNVIVLRTFSKVYGMAGIRAGMAMARPDLLSKLRPYGVGFVPITAMGAATASLKSKTLVPERRKINADIRQNVFEFLDAKGYKFTPSEANHFMIDVRRPGNQVVEALAKENVMIGRLWPAWPNHVRVSVGTQEDMDKFKAAFTKVMA